MVLSEASDFAISVSSGGIYNILVNVILIINTANTNKTVWFLNN